MSLFAGRSAEPIRCRTGRAPEPERDPKVLRPLVDFKQGRELLPELESAYEFLTTLPEAHPKAGNHQLRNAMVYALEYLADPRATDAFSILKLASELSRIDGMADLAIGWHRLYQRADAVHRTGRDQVTIRGAVR